MDYMTLITALVIPVLLTWYGSLEWRLRTMRSKLDNTLPKKDVIELIDMKQEALYVLQREIKEDISDIKRKIDKLVP